MNITEPFYNITDSINLLATAMMTTMVIFGSVCNFLIIYSFRKDKNERTSFNLICFFRSSVNLYIIISTFALVFIPIVVIGKSHLNPLLETIDITLTNNLYLVNEYITMIVAFNRFIAMYFPFHYSKLCGVMPTMFFLLCILIFRLVIFIDEVDWTDSKSCYTLFRPELLAWSQDESCQNNQSFLMDFTAILFITVSFANFLTFLKIISFYLKRNGEMASSSRRKIRKNILLFFQTLLQDSLYGIDLSFTFKFSSFFNNRFWTFICGTFVWQCLHSFDGFIMIMFNEKLSFLKKTLFDKPQSSVTLAKTITVNNIG